LDFAVISLTYDEHISRDLIDSFIKETKAQPGNPLFSGKYSNIIISGKYINVSEL